MDKKMLPMILAVYLPQFHETEDNNQWWGKGFTDWESVRNAEAYFPGHKAPWIPYGANYYNLNSYETMQWQAELAKKYGIDGFCFYHYYFKDGKKELETPAENLLRWPDIDMPFCFNWASESWIRSWSRLTGNVWSEKYEICSSYGEKNGVLVLQDYGKEDAWKAHFHYLLPFFKDRRYIKIDNKPVFIFYRPNEIKPLEPMIQLWREMAQESGLDGLYLIGVNVNVSCSQLDASMIYEPRNAINRLNGNNRAKMAGQVRCFDYKEIWDEVLGVSSYAGCKTYFMGVTGYDDTPRRGRCGECMVNNTPEIFEEGIKNLLVKSVQQRNELVFINAWNEWGEGMYLEPDETNGFKYLEAVKNAKKEIKRTIRGIGTAVTSNKENDEIKRLLYENKKYVAFIEMLDKWLSLERDRKLSFSKYFEQMSINTVAIYGMARMGKQLYAQLNSEKIKVCFGIDRYVGQHGSMKIIRPEEDYPDVGAIIITTYDLDEIVKLISSKSAAVIITLGEILEYFWRNQ